MRPRLVSDRSIEQPRFVCTWCGDPFASRDALEVHWAANSICRNQKMVNNPYYTHNANQMRRCACGHDDKSHTKPDGSCYHCSCVVFSLAGFR